MVTKNTAKKTAGAARARSSAKTLPKAAGGGAKKPKRILACPEPKIAGPKAADTAKPKKAEAPPKLDLESIKSKMPVEARETFQKLIDGESGAALVRTIDQFVDEMHLHSPKDWVRPYKAIEKFNQAQNCAMKLKGLIEELKAVESYWALAPGDATVFAKYKSRGWTLLGELAEFAESMERASNFTTSNRQKLNDFLDLYTTPSQRLVFRIFWYLIGAEQDSETNHALEIARAIFHEVTGSPPPLDWERTFFAKLAQGKVNIQSEVDLLELEDFEEANRGQSATLAKKLRTVPNLMLFDVDNPNWIHFFTQEHG